MNFAQRKVFHIKKKGRGYDFQYKGKVDAMDFWQQKNIFTNVGSWQKDDLSTVFFKKRGGWCQGPIKKQKSNKMIFSLAWNIMFTDN